MHKAFAIAASLAWAIDQHTLTTILEIANREGAGPEAVATQLGRPLENTRTVTVREGVAIIPVVGPVFRRANAFGDVSGPMTSIQVLAREFATAVRDPSVTSILLEIDSPGGEVNGVHEFAQQVFSSRGIKPIVAYVGGMGASAAYWIASAADEIVADPTASLGSIGVIMAMPKPEGDAAKEIEIVSSQSPNKRVDVSTKTGKALVQARVDAMADIFVATVARNRGVDTETVLDKFGKGGVLLGEAAQKAGMVDRIDSLEGTIATLSQKQRARTSTGKARTNMSGKLPLITSLALICGLTADCSEEDLTAAVKERETARGERDELLAAVGEKSTIKAIGAIETQRGDAAKLADVTKERDELRAVIAKQEHASLVATLRGDGKLTAHMEKLASKMTLEQLREFAKDAEPVAALTAKKTNEPEATTAIALIHNGKTWEQMTGAEKSELHKSDPKLFAAMYADFKKRNPD